MPAEIEIGTSHLVGEFRFQLRRDSKGIWFIARVDCDFDRDRVTAVDSFATEQEARRRFSELKKLIYSPSA